MNELVRVTETALTSEQDLLLVLHDDPNTYGHYVVSLLTEHLLFSEHDAWRTAIDISEVSAAPVFRGPLAVLREKLTPILADVEMNLKHNTLSDEDGDPILCLRFSIMSQLEYDELVRAFRERRAVQLSTPLKLSGRMRQIPLARTAGDVPDAEDDDSWF